MHESGKHRSNAAPLAAKRHHTVPPGTGTFGMILFLLALGMLFAASVIGYILIRVNLREQIPLGTIDLPAGLWVSTFCILASSYTIHHALQSVRYERQTAFRNAMTLTLLLGSAFLIIQAPAMLALLREHQNLMQLDNGSAIFGLIFFFILVHAAHVIGGFVPLLVTTFKAHTGRYDHEHHNPVKHLAMYWHFLDGAWIVLFLAFLLLA